MVSGGLHHDESGGVYKHGQLSNDELNSLVQQMDSKQQEQALKMDYLYATLMQEQQPEQRYT